MTYSALDRFHDALSGRPMDHVPVFPLIAGWAAANFSSLPLSELASRPEGIVEAQIRARESMGYDALFAYANPLYIPAAFGCRVRFLETGPLADPLPMEITGPAQVDRLSIPDVEGNENLSVTLETVRRISAYGMGRMPVLGLFEGPFTTICRILETDLVMRLPHRNPEALEALLDRMTQFLLDLARALIKHGANTLFVPEPTASSSMISPAMFRRFVLPRLKTLTSQLSVPCILHICGDTMPALQAMGETGAQVLSLDQCMNLGAARSRVPGAVLGGNVDPINSLLMGTEEKVVTDTLNCLRTGGCSRFILMSGCSVPPRTPMENLKRMVQTAKEYGLGP